MLFIQTANERGLNCIFKSDVELVLSRIYHVREHFTLSYQVGNELRFFKEFL
jgi:hypothetical protein